MIATLTASILGSFYAGRGFTLAAGAGSGADGAHHYEPVIPAELPLHHFYLGAGIALLLLMIPILYRVAAGPTAIDRIVAINVIGTKTAVLLVIIGTVFGKVEMFVDFALAYALLNFIGSLAAARFLHRDPEKAHPAGKLTPPDNA